MKKNTYAAFYLPKPPVEEKKPDKELIDRNAGFMTSAVRKLKGLTTDVSSNIKNIAKNMDIQGATALVQKYATCALTDILTNQPVKDQKMLDYLFNTYAPALNLTLVQTEFNSLQEMYNAAMSGQINVANFVQGFSNSMTAITEQKRQQSYLDYGEELPIDVVEQFNFQADKDIAFNKVGSAPHYLYHVEKMNLILVGHIKNENAEFWRSGDYVNKLVARRDDDNYIVLRVGNNFYEKCLVRELDGEITSLYSLKIKVTLRYSYYENYFSAEQKGVRIMNPDAEIFKDIPIETVNVGVKK